MRVGSARAGSLCPSGPALSGLPVPSPRPAGPGTGRDSSPRLPAPQRADRLQLGQSSASWRHTWRTQSVVVVWVFFARSSFHFILLHSFHIHSPSCEDPNKMFSDRSKSTLVWSCCSRRVCSCRWPSVSWSSSSGPSSQDLRLTLSNTGTSGHTLARCFIQKQKKSTSKNAAGGSDTTQHAAIRRVVY